MIQPHELEIGMLLEYDKHWRGDRIVLKVQRIGLEQVGLRVVERSGVYEKNGTRVSHDVLWLLDNTVIVKQHVPMGLMR